MSDPHTHQSNGFTNGASQSGRPENESPGEQGEQGHSHGPEQQCLEFCPICRAADILRASAPPELREQWQTVQREMLLTTQALIQHYLSRLDEDQPGREPEPRVQDIPIF